MRFPQETAMADGSDGPVWARTRRRRLSAGPLMGFIVAVLALIGALTVGLSIKDRSVAEAGATMDRWIDSGWTAGKRLVGRAPEAAEQAVDKAGAAVGKAGDVQEAGAGPAEQQPIGH